MKKQSAQSPIPPEAIAELRMLRDRLNDKASILGQWDLQVAQAEVQRQQARVDAAKEQAELQQKLNAAARAQGVFGQMGWVFDFTAGRFVRQQGP